MPGPTKRRKYHQGITTEKKKYRTKRRTRDIDLICEDLDHPEKFEKKPIDFDLPGGGQFYCLHCAKHYISQHALEEHRRGKVHKKRVKETEEVPYSVEESERAGGLGSYLPPPAKRSKPNPTLIEDDIKIADD
ncbi:zinc finger protein 593 homolog [Folsomia candida]|uniref:zinc finger protein 593 homolog n=1 Tax=Folsomia candida TaxID=158441 RepID=UPI000B8F8EB1|nr:zinc finger protein 593 homolog [Folsomia candida]